MPSEDKEVSSNTLEIPKNQAVNNIKKAKQFNVHPDSYANMDDDLKKELEIDKQRTPDVVTKSMRKKTQNSEQEAVIYGPGGGEIERYDSMLWKHTVDSARGTSFNRRQNVFNDILSRGGKLTTAQRVEMSNLIRSNNRLKSAEDLNLNTVESLPGEVAGALYGIGEAIWQGRETSLGAATILGTAGAVIGTVAGGPGLGLAAGRVGITAGLSIGTALSLTGDTFVQTRGGIYGELKANVSGDDSPEREKSRQNIALGGAIATTALNLVSGFFLAKMVPFLGKMISSSAAKNAPFLNKVFSGKGGVGASLARETNKPINAGWNKLFTDLGKSSAIEGGEEFSEEYIQILSKNMDKSWDGTETSFKKALENTILDWENFKRAGRAGVVGGIVGPILVGGGKFVSPAVEAATVKVRKQPKQLGEPRETVIGGEFTPDVSPEIIGSDIPLNPSIKDVTPQAEGFTPNSDLVGDAKDLTPDEQGMTSLKFADLFEQTNGVIEETIINQEFPEDMSEIKQEMFDKNGIPHVYLNREELSQWVGDDPDKATDIEAIINSITKEDSDLNADIQVPSGIFSDLVKKYPKSISLLVKPNSESLSGKAYTDALNNKVQKNTPEDIFDQEGYLDQKTFENDKDNKALQDIRKKIVENMNEDPTQNHIIPLENQKANAQEAQLRKESVESEQNVNLVEDYLANNKVIGQLTEAEQKRKDKGKPVHTIDLDKLTPELRNQYKDDVVLKKRGVFSKKGGDPQEIANFYGLEDVENLLEVLSTTPTRKQIEKNAQAEIKKTETKEKNTIKLYIEEAEIHLNEILTIIEQNDVTNSPVVPSIGRLKHDAARKIRGIKIKHLDVNQAKVALRRSQAKAKQALKDGDRVLAITEKVKAAYNAVLISETHKTIRDINESFALITKMNSSEVKAILADVDIIFTDAIAGLMAFYNLGTIEGRKAKAESFNRLVQLMKRQARGDFRIIIKDTVGDNIQKDTSENLEVQRKDNIGDMTGGEILYIGGILERIVKEATLNNVFLSDALGVENTTMEIRADEIREVVINLRKFNPDKIDDLKNTTTIEQLKQDGPEFLTLLNTMRWVLIDGDDGQLQGYLQRTFLNPMLGSGEHEGSYGLNATKKLEGKVSDRIKAIKKAYGKNKFNNLNIKLIKIPEFSEEKALNNGNLTKMDLMMLLANMGSESNIDAVRSFNIDPDRIMKILERELTKKDFQLVQDLMWVTFRDFRPLLEKLQKDSKGKDLVFIEPEGFFAHGQQWTGGYFPIKRLRNSDLNAVEAKDRMTLDLSDPAKAGSVFHDDIYSGVLNSDVRAPHLNERGLSDLPLNLSFESFEQSIQEFIHDLTMRVPVRDTMTLLAQPSVSRALRGLLGTAKYNLLVNTVAEQTNSIAANNSRLYSSMQKNLNSLMTVMDAGITTAFLVWNPSTIAVTFLPITQIIKQLGLKNFIKYAPKAALDIWGSQVFDRTKHKGVMDMIRGIDPSVNAMMLNLDEHSGGVMTNVTPKKRLFESTKYNYIKTAQERAIALSIGKVLGTIDLQYKALAVRMAYAMFLDGNAPGFPMSKLDKMGLEEITAAARAFAESFSGTTTMQSDKISKAIIQKISGGGLITKFWNEPRDVGRSNIQKGKDVGRDGQKLLQAGRDNDYEAAANAFYGTAGDIGTVVLTSMMSMAILNFAAGLGRDDDETEDVFTLETLTTPGGLMKIINNALFSHLPIIRDIIFGGKIGRPPSTPLFKYLDDVRIISFEASPFLLEQLANDVSFLEAAEQLTDREKKSMLTLLSPILKGVPVNGPFKIGKIIENSDIKFSKFDPDTALSVLKAFIKKFDANQDASQLTLQERLDLANRIRNNDTTVMQDIVNQIKDTINKIQPPSKGEPLSDESYEIIKYVESKNNWRAGSGTSGAFGIYQFLPGIPSKVATKTKKAVEATGWHKIVESPEGKAAGITVGGRLLRNPRQQEAAMRIWTKWNKRDLIKNGVAVNIETLYFAHHFGSGGAAKVYNGSANKRIPGVLTPKVLAANENLVTRKVKTAGDMRKHIKWLLSEGVRLRDKDR